MTRIHVLGIALGLLGAVAVSMGQTREDLPPGSYLSLRQRSAWLLNYRGVVHALGLSDSEQQSLKQARDSYEKSESQMESRSNPPSDAQIQALDLKFADSALGALTPTHRDRLYQAVLQVQGAEALTDRGVAVRLGLSEAESGHIRGIFATAAKREEDFDAALAQKLLAVPRIAPAKLYVQKRNAVVAAAQPQREQLVKQRRADEEKALAVLSEQQNVKWKQMQGAPFPLPRGRG